MTLPENNILFNATGSDSFITDLLKHSITYFFAELNHFMTHNQDYSVLEYANEQTLAAMFVNSIIRNDKEEKISALQEYGTVFEAGGSYGRPDIFLRVNDTALYIECKYDKTKNIRSDHWNIEGWLTWDKTAIFDQVMAYCTAEKLNESFSGGCYAVTMVFKLIDDQSLTHGILVNEHMMGKSETYGQRQWYYAYGNQILNDSKYWGLEIYGTFREI